MIQHELLQFLDKTEQILIGWLRLELANSDDRGQRFFEFGLRPIIGPMPRREVEMRNAEWEIMIYGISAETVQLDLSQLDISLSYWQPNSCKQSFQ